MNGAEFLLKTALSANISVCFANPGTTEIPLALMLDSEPGIKAILGLFEGVCTGAADGYGRMLDRPALTLLHLGPGLANGLANLHNARKARTPLVNLIGEQASWHRSVNAPLAMDIETLASTVSGWYKTSASPATLSQDLSEAISASRYGQISTLMVPNDYQKADCGSGEIATPHFSFDVIDSALIDKAAQFLRTNKTALIMGGRALRERGLKAAVRIKAATGCELISEHLPPHIDMGAGLPFTNRIPYFPEAALKLLSGYQAVVLAGTGEPVTFFGYQGFASHLLREGQKKTIITNGRQDVIEALENLADVLNAPNNSKIGDDIVSRSARPVIPGGELTSLNICLTLAALQPDNSIIVDEGLTTSGHYWELAARLPRHSYLTTVGGAIGCGLPCGLGASIACPDRQVICLQADGSAMYTIQALWTMARESSNVITLICSNRSYHILKLELARAGATSFGPKVSSLIDLDRPDINWVKLAEGMGVPAVSANNVEGLAKEFCRALSETGPHLIEIAMSPL